MMPDPAGGEIPAPTLGETGLQRFAPYLMNRIMGRYNASLREELGRSGLTTAKMRTLAVLSVNNGLMINELSVYTVTEQSTMSRTLDALEGAGLVRREAQDEDSRVRRIFITDEGRAVFEELWPSIREANERLFAGIGDDEREAFVATLQKMLRNIRRHPF